MTRLKLFACGIESSSVNIAAEFVMSSGRLVNCSIQVSM